MRVCAVWVAIVPATCTFIYTLHPHTTHVRRLARCMRSRKRPHPPPPPLLCHRQEVLKRVQLLMVLIAPVAAEKSPPTRT